MGEVHLKFYHLLLFIMSIKKKIASLILGLSLGFSSYKAEDKGSFLGEIEHVGGQRASLEMYASKSFDTETTLGLYSSYHKHLQTNKDLSIMRGDLLQEVSDNFKLGFAQKFTYVNGNKINNEIGIIAQFKNKGEDSLQIVNARYFHENKRIEVFGFHKGKSIYADMLAFYSLENKKGFVRSSLGYNILPNVSVGIETVFNIKDDSLKHNYTGPRIRYTF